MEGCKRVGFGFEFGWNSPGGDQAQGVAGEGGVA